MPNYDAVVVFGTQLNDKGEFPQFVYQLIDSAIGILAQNKAETFIFCGSHAMKSGLSGRKEADVAYEYVRRYHSNFIHRMKLEKHSTNIPENWLFLKVNFPSLRSIYLITIRPLLPRIKFLGDWIYGNDATLTFGTLPEDEKEFPNEKRLLQDAECTLLKRNKMRRGDHTFLLKKKTESRWNELRLDHHNCPRYGNLHHM